MQIGEKIISFNLKGTDGKMHSDKDFGKNDLLCIIFSCNHCPYVKAYEKRMIALQKKYKDENVHLICINSNDPVKYPEDSFENMVRNAEQKKFNFPYLYDADQSIARAYNAERTPEVFFFNKNRKLVYHGAIDDNWQDEFAVTYIYLENAIEHVLEGIEVDLVETKPVGCSIKWK